MIPTLPTFGKITYFNLLLVYLIGDIRSSGIRENIRGLIPLCLFTRELWYNNLIINNIITIVNDNAISDREIVGGFDSLAPTKFYSYGY